MEENNLKEITISDAANPEMPHQIQAQKGSNTPSPRVYKISEKTELRYQYIVKSLQRASEEKREKNSGMTEWYNLTPVNVIEDLLERKDEVAPVTIVTYLAALTWHFKKTIDNPNSAEALALIDRFLAETKANKSQVKSQNGKRKKVRTIPKADLHELLEELTDRHVRGSIWAGRAHRWMLATLATGLRPSEWYMARWLNPEKTILLVVNGKQKSDISGFLRGKETETIDVTATQLEPKTREVSIESEVDRITIDEHMQLIAAFLQNENADFETYRKRSSLQIWRACKKLWGTNTKKIYGLYTSRGQFSANMLDSVGKIKTSKLMGHSRPDTPSASFYGVSSQAYSRTGAGYRKPKTQQEGDSLSEELNQLANLPIGAPADTAQSQIDTGSSE